jgi:hypothetical protein
MDHGEGDEHEHDDQQAQAHDSPAGTASQRAG